MLPLRPLSGTRLKVSPQGVGTISKSVDRVSTRESRVKTTMTSGQSDGRIEGASCLTEMRNAIIKCLPLFCFEGHWCHQSKCTQRGPFPFGLMPYISPAKETKSARVACRRGDFQVRLTFEAFETIVDSPTPAAWGKGQFRHFSVVRKWEIRLTMMKREVGGQR